MRARTAFAAAALWFYLPASSWGAGVTLKWTSCFGDGGGWNRSFRCDTNAGRSELVAGFELGTEVPAVTSVRVSVEATVDSPGGIAWWSLTGSSGCRAGSLTASGEIGADAVNCLDWSRSAPSRIVAGPAIALVGLNAMRITVTSAVDAPDAVSLFAAQEYQACRLLLDHVRTVGSDACAGCQVSAEFCLTSVVLVSAAGPATEVVLTGPADAQTSHVATWQGWLSARPCGVRTATRQSAWGVIKSLYR